MLSGAAGAVLGCCEVVSWFIVGVLLIQVGGTLLGVISWIHDGDRLRCSICGWISASNERA